MPEYALGIAHLLQIMGALASQEPVCISADEVVQGHQNVVQVVNGPGVECLADTRPQCPHPLRDLQGGALLAGPVVQAGSHEICKGYQCLSIPMHHKDFCNAMWPVLAELTQRLICRKHSINKSRSPSGIQDLTHPQINRDLQRLYACASRARRDCKGTLLAVSCTPVLMALCLLHALCVSYLQCIFAEACSLLCLPTRRPHFLQKIKGSARAAQAVKQPM